MKVTVIPVIIGALGTVTKRLIEGLEDQEIRGRVEIIKLQFYLSIFTITICDIDYATQSHTWKIHRELQTNKSAKDQPTYIHEQHQTVYLNNKEMETLIKRIHSQYIGMEFGIEKCAILIIRSEKRL